MIDGFKVCQDMSADDLRHQVQLMPPTESRDKKGDRIYTYDTKTPIRANVEEYVVRIINSTGEQDSAIQYRIIIRYRDYINRNYRIQYNGQNLRIIKKPVDAGGRHMWLIMDCEDI